MARLPKRTQEHVTDAEAIKMIKNIIPSEWIVEEPQYDYGTDIRVNITLNGKVLGAYFMIQSKGTVNIKITKDGYISHKCQTSSLMYFIDHSDLFIYIVCDVKRKIAYWTWIQDYVYNHLDRSWRNQKEATIYISEKNIFDETAIKEIFKKVLERHERNRMLAKIQTVNNPFYRFDFQTIENGYSISVDTKYEGADRDDPQEFEMTLAFDESEKAQEMKRMVDNAFKKGDSVRIEKEFVRHFRFPEVMAALIDQFKSFELQAIEILGYPITEIIPLHIEFIDSQGNTLREFRYVEMMILKKGLEEVSLSNKHQPKVIHIEMICNLVDSEISTDLSINDQNRDPIGFIEFIRTAKDVKNASQVKITNLKNEKTDTFSALIGLDLGDLESIGLMKVMEMLAFIQKKTDQRILIPEQLSVNIIDLMQIINILNSGKLIIKTPIFKFNTKKRYARDLLDVNGFLSISLKSNNHIYSIAGNSIELGPLTLLLPNVRLTRESIDRLRSIEETPEDTPIEISVYLNDQGAVHIFENWLPEETLPSDGLTLSS